MSTELSRGDADFLIGDEVHSSGKSARGDFLSRSDPVRCKVENIIDNMLMWGSPHSFHLDSIEGFSCDSQRRKIFRDHLLCKYANPDPHLTFHGTRESNHQSIFSNGFIIPGDDARGETDKGWIGKGVYCSPHPEYAASYINCNNGINRFNYYNPVKIGSSFKLLACITLVSRTRQLFQMQDKHGQAIPAYLESQWAWVTKKGEHTGASADYFAIEYVMRDPIDIYPRFRISLTRVTRELIWLDPNIENSENASHVQEIKKDSNIFLYSTTSATRALKALEKRKPSTDYRAMTAGTGGESFVSSLRSSGIHCKVLVFCGNVEYHKTWAKKFSNVEVTMSQEYMKKFAAWK